MSLDCRAIYRSLEEFHFNLSFIVQQFVLSVNKGPALPFKEMDLNTYLDKSGFQRFGTHFYLDVTLTPHDGRWR
jgi:hypothetical protein